MTSNRKDEHVQLAVDQQASPINQFDQLHFMHHALGGTDPEKIDLSTSVAGHHWNFPLYINAMTGGSEKTGVINAQLARAAHRTGIAIASGSLSVYFKDRSLADSFTVLRRENPNGFVFANVNGTASVSQAKEAVELLEANALQIHTNMVQEIVMPEGDHHFSSWAENIHEIADSLSVPVIVKEVGFGISAKTIEQLNALGVQTVDLSGSGGTNFAIIENSRRTESDYSFLYDWGQSTAACLLDMASVRSDVDSEILASGGVRQPLDAVKALAFGAKAVGVSGLFLKTILDHGEDGLVQLVESWLDQMTGLMAVLGAETVSELKNTDVLIQAGLAEFARTRGIDVASFANRRGRL